MKRKFWKLVVGVACGLEGCGLGTLYLGLPALTASLHIAVVSFDWLAIFSAVFIVALISSSPGITLLIKPEKNREKFMWHDIQT